MRFCGLQESHPNPKLQVVLFVFKINFMGNSLSRGLIDLDITARKFLTSGQIVELFLLLILL
jgi:hypothetical protein